jgi:hypothetical protein
MLVAIFVQPPPQVAAGLMPSECARSHPTAGILEALLPLLFAEIEYIRVNNLRQMISLNLPLLLPSDLEVRGTVADGASPRSES